MHTSNLYYEAPSDAIFEEMKTCCMEVWSNYDDTYGYRREKLALVTPIRNVKDNFMYMFGMFDINNQKLVVEKLGDEAKTALLDRLIAGGNEEWFIRSLGL